MSSVILPLPMEEFSLKARLHAEYEGHPEHRRRIRMPYDDLLSLFTDESRNWCDIARTLGVTPQAVRQLYQRFFQPVIGKSGLELRRQRARQAREEVVRELPTDTVLRVVALAAEKAGLTVRQVASGDWLRQRALQIQEHLCRVHHCVSMVGPPKDPHAIHVKTDFLRPSGAPYAAYVVYAAVPGRRRRFFVVPRYVVNRMPQHGDYVHAWIPLERRPVYHNIRPRVDWLRYENAWHLLE